MILCRNPDSRGNGENSGVKVDFQENSGKFRPFFGGFPHHDPTYAIPGARREGQIGEGFAVTSQNILAAEMLRVELVRVVVVL